MTINVKGYAAESAVDKLKPYSFERLEPRAEDVVIDILYVVSAIQIFTQQKASGKVHNILAFLGMRLLVA